LIVGEPAASQGFFELGVSGGGRIYFSKHANTHMRPTQNSPDKPRSIEPRPIVALIIGEPAANQVFFELGVSGGGRIYFSEHANTHMLPTQNSPDKPRSINLGRLWL
jgi:hypothetical protein